MTYRNQALQAEMAARRVDERRRRATTQHDVAHESSAWLWWLGGLSAVVAALALLP